MTDVLKAKLAAGASVVEGGGTVFFALTDTVSISIVTGIVAIVTGFVSAYFAYKARKNVAVVETKVDAVAEVMETKVDAVAKTGEKVHKLVNSAMTTQLQLNSIMARRLAGLTKSKIDVKAAELAEKNYSAHKANQKNI